MNEVTLLISILVAFQIASFIATWKLFKLAGEQSWKAAVPVLSQFTIIKLIERPKWWILLIFLPVIGPVMLLVIYGELIRLFGKRTTTDCLLTFFLGLFYIGFINYNKETKYIGVEERKDTFIASILFAVVLATTVHTFLIQPMIIPTGSMENTLRIGDALFVEKVSNGLRIPNTPVSIPFSDIFYRKAYLKQVQLPYMRLPGWADYKANDIVVFNYPTDTVHVPVDRKDPYVKRLVGEPGDSLQIVNSDLFINGKKFQPKKDALLQYSYFVQSKTPLNAKYLQNDFELVNTQPGTTKVDYLLRGQNQAGNYEYLFFGLNDEHLAEFKKNKNILSVTKNVQQQPNNPTSFTNLSPSDSANYLFPINSGWNRDNYGPLYIPKKGDKVNLNTQNLDQYHDIVNEYEENDLSIKNGKLYDKGTEVASVDYTIQQNYYFMMGDNRHNSADSRFFGYVPEDHLVGRPVLLWANLNNIFGFEKKHGWKWSRWFTVPNNDQTNKTSYRYFALLLLLIYFGWDWWQNKKKKAKDKA